VPFTIHQVRLLAFPFFFLVVCTAGQTGAAICFCAFLLPVLNTAPWSVFHPRETHSLVTGLPPRLVKHSAGLLFLHLLHLPKLLALICHFLEYHPKKASPTPDPHRQDPPPGDVDRSFPPLPISRTCFFFDCSRSVGSEPPLTRPLNYFFLFTKPSPPAPFPGPPLVSPGPGGQCCVVEFSSSPGEGILPFRPHIPHRSFRFNLPWR